MPSRRRPRARYRSKFSSLPAELRLMVWEHTFLPRILHVVPHGGGITPRLRLKPPYLPVRVPYKILAPPLPVALYVCHESRDFALKHYKPAFHPPTKHSFRASTRMQSLRATYFNPDLDVVFVDSRYDMMMIHKLSRHTEETVRTIKVLAVADRFGMRQSDMWVDSLKFPHLWEDLAKFERLEEIIHVVRDGMRSGEQYLTWKRLPGGEVPETYLSRFRNLLRTTLGEGRKLPVVRELKWEDLKAELEQR